jgi:hypothetical protein
MVYTWHIHVYSWLCLSGFVGRSVLLVSINAHTCVGDQDWFIPRATMAIVPLEKDDDKRLILSWSSDCRTLSPARLRLALRGAAGRFRGGRLGSLVFAEVASSSSPSPSPPPPLSPPLSAAAAAAAAEAARASFLALSL